MLSQVKGADPVGSETDVALGAARYYMRNSMGPSTTTTEFARRAMGQLLVVLRQSDSHRLAALGTVEDVDTVHSFEIHKLEPHVKADGEHVGLRKTGDELGGASPEGVVGVHCVHALDPFSDRTRNVGLLDALRTGVVCHLVLPLLSVPILLHIWGPVNLFESEHLGPGQQGLERLIGVWFAVDRHQVLVDPKLWQCGLLSLEERLGIKVERGVLHT